MDTGVSCGSTNQVFEAESNPDCKCIEGLPNCDSNHDAGA